MKEEYFNLLTEFETLGGEKQFAEGERTKKMVTLRNRIKTIEAQLTSTEVITWLREYNKK